MVVYGLVDPRSGECRYVGLTYSARDRFSLHLNEARRKDTPKGRWINDLRDEGFQPSLVVLERPDFQRCHEAEQGWIRLLSGSNDLFNVDWNPHVPVERWSPKARGQQWRQRFGGRA